MSRVLYFGSIYAEAFLCIMLTLGLGSFPVVFPTAMSYPFDLIGLALRALSLSSGAGNAVALTIYIAICILPLAALVILRIRRKLHPEDYLLGLLSVALFAVLYLMVNPRLISMFTDGHLGQPYGQMALGCVIYSLAAGYIVFKILRLFTAGDADALYRYTAIVLVLFGLVFTFMIFGVSFPALYVALPDVQLSDLWLGMSSYYGIFYLVLRFIVDILPNLFALVIIAATLKLLECLRANRYSSQSKAAADRLSKICVAFLTATVLANIVFNLAQALMLRSLGGFEVAVQIPIVALAFGLVVLLLARFVTESKRLQDDNDMFI